MKTPLVRKDAEKNEKGIKRTKLLIHITLLTLQLNMLICFIGFLVFEHIW